MAGPAYSNGDEVVLKTAAELGPIFVSNKIFKNCDTRVYKATLLSGKQGIVSDVTETTISFVENGQTSKYIKLPITVVDHKVLEG